MPEHNNAPLPYDGKSKVLSDLLSNHFTSMESLSEKFRDAINMHLASEGLLANEDEKSILLNLSNEIAASKNKDDLFEVIHSTMQAFFDLNGLTIIRTDAEPHIYEFYKFEKEFPKPNEIKLKKSNEVINDPDLALVLEQLTSSSAPVYHDTTEVIRQFPGIEYFKIWKSKGWAKFSIVALKAGGGPLGYLLVHMLPAAVGSLRVNLLKGICAQLSVAISNMNMIEETVRRKNEMELLLSINTAIACVRNTDELADFIKDKFKKLLGCSHTLIAVCNDDGLTFRAFLLDDDAKAKAQSSNLETIDARYEINDSVLSNAMQTSLPLLFDLDELSLQENLPLYIKINHDLQQKALLVTRLSNNEKIVGFWFIYFKDRHIITSGKLKLIESLSHQLCISVANIISNQEIKHRDDEKGRLLKFSRALASVREKKVLSQILKVQLHELFGIEDYVIHIFDIEQAKYRPIFYDNEAALPNHPDSDKAFSAWENVPEGFLEQFLSTEGPVLYQADQNSANSDKHSERLVSVIPRIGIMIQLGLDGTALLSFTHPNYKKIKQQEELLKSICSQISIAISNILANEQVNQQLIEIDKYKRQLEEETIYLKEEIEVNQNYAEIIGDSPLMQKTFRMITQVAPSDSTVLILGETGTGKELIARAIHNNSPRKNKLMVKVNCAALPANLIESELFGHERGSFTGATERRLGKFELANNGTLFLDEIGEMPLELQVKLLRALQEKEIERVGGRGTIKVDVRIIAATNRDLEKEVDEGRFRNDLFYRLNIFPISLPPLRDRKEDIPVLASHFVQRYSKKTGRQITTIGNKAMQDMIHYSWPGNIRELEHLIERSILLSTGPALKQIHLPTNKPGTSLHTSNGEISLKTIDENETEHILNILKYCHGRISGPGGAAEVLGVPPSTLNSKIKKLGIKKEHLI